MVLRFFGSAELLLLHCHEHLIRNNGLMGVGVEIPIHEANVFNLRNAGANRLLEQYPSSVFFVGEQLVNCFPIPFQGNSI